MLKISPVLIPAALIWGGCVTLLIQKKVLDMISAAGFVRPNFQGHLIPVSSGVIFPVSLTAACVPLIFLWPAKHLAQVFIYIFVITFAAFLGLVDDFWGSRETSGLKGHLGVLIKKGKVTTGGLKAVWGGILALVVAGVSGPLVHLPVNALLLALLINAINLLDLRPGRAGKVFILGALALGAVGYRQEEIILLALLLGGVAVFLPLDLRAKTMMGDAGSNALGAALGVMAVWLLEWPAKLILLAFLIAFHMFTEKYSLTKIIAQNRFLNFLDHLGRGK